METSRLKPTVEDVTVTGRAITAAEAESRITPFVTNEAGSGDLSTDGAQLPQQAGRAIAAAWEDSPLGQQSVHVAAAGPAQSAKTSSTATAVRRGFIPVTV